MIILVFHTAFRSFERYLLEPFEQMPYTSHNALKVSEFCSQSRSSLLWTTKDAMDCYMNHYHKNPSTRVTHAFRRIWEGGHTIFSSHYIGEGFDLSDGHHLSPYSPLPYPDLQYGAVGVPVLVLQDALFTLGFDCMALDGYWGVHTEHALKEFAASFFVPYHGIVDEFFWRQLLFFACGSDKNILRKKNKD
ncbi:MAG: hypothetical protein IJC88_02765 [Oscillospiraceae bacterium]|nr:hypothetical protein [Oscillospiraceae bacterium]